MTSAGQVLAGGVRESQLPGPVPLFEVPGWRELGARAGITGRGTTEEPWDLGLWTRSPVGDVMGRWRRLRAALAPSQGLVLSHQVHGAEIGTHDRGLGWSILDGLDGHTTSVAGLVLTVTVADCIPVYLFDPVGRRIGLVHAGWRGTAAGILPRALERMTADGSSPADVIVHCGVGICGACYEVGSEVMAACGMAADGAGPWHLDLRAVLARQAADAGIRTISTSQMCSAHDQGHYFSHRRSRGTDGRMVAYLALLP